jgi:glycosyltransferase involved in cell wall biosynthesis
MMQEKKISVIIPNYNYARYLKSAIESVLNQSHKNVELIVVNNGSTDNSLEVLESYGTKIRLIDQPNLGQSGARNSGLINSTGEYIAFLDADDFWEPSKLQKQIALLSDSTQLIYCGTAPFKYPSARSMPIVLPLYSGNCMRFFIERPGASIVLSGESTALFSRTLLQKVGVFDLELNSSAGWDFFRRCSEITEFNFVNEPLVNYRLHANNMSKSSNNVITDVRRAYAKLFQDTNWQIPRKSEVEILRSLEWSYVKSYLRNREIKLAMSSLTNLARLNSKYE